MSLSEVKAVALQNANMQGRRIKNNDEPTFTVSATDRHGVAISMPQILTHDEHEKESDILTSTKRKSYDLKPFTYASLFSGIGGFEQALNRLGGTCVFASEIDKFAVQAYEVLYGEKPAGDITKIEAKDIPDHDLLVGGFPCQSFSLAGKRKGFEDTRGTLFFEIARIAKEKRPKALLLENVKGLVNHDKGNTLDTMIRTLNEIGYVVDFDVLNSKYFGVPQNRERIFIVAIREDLIEAEPFNEETTTGNTIVPKGKRRIGEWANVFNFDWPAQEEVTTRLRDILESNVDEKYYLDEEKTAKLVAQLEDRNQIKGETPLPLNYLSRGTESRGDGVSYAIKAGRCHELLERPYHFPTPDDVNNTLRTGGKGSLTAKHNYDHIAEPQMVGHVDIKGHDAIKRTYSTEGISPTLTTMEGGHRQPKIAEEQEDRPVLTPDRVEKRQNGRRFKEDGEESFTLTAQDRHGVALGEVRPTALQNANMQGRRIKENDEPAFTVSATDRHGVTLGGRPRYRIRKLTPLECFRLQGFPDEAHQALVDAGISDSQRYKQAGNAVTVNVIEAIGERLIPLIEK